MRRFVAQGIILTRTDFGEADRIITFLTPDHGKVQAIAKGVRKSKSKLAGGIELFSISDLTFLVGRSEIYTLISSRLVKHYGNIVKDLDRTNAAYELLRVSNKATEQAPEPAYFKLLNLALQALDNPKLDSQITALWFSMQLLKLAGHAPNLRTDSRGAQLAKSAAYDFQLDRMHFVPEKSSRGTFTANHIKFLRVGFAAANPKVLARVEGIDKLAVLTQPLIQTMLKSFVRI